MVLDHLEEYFLSDEEMRELPVGDRSERWETFREVCGCSKSAYQAWFNRSRKNVRIPLLYLCRLAEHLKEDVFDLMK